MQGVTTIGLDIAQVGFFQVHDVDAAENVLIGRQRKRRYVLTFFQKLPPCLVGIEACAASHHWSRELLAIGHAVRLMPPAWVKSNVKRQKNHAADAEPICETVPRPNMLETKSPSSTAALMPHRTRPRFTRHDGRRQGARRRHRRRFPDQEYHGAGPGDARRRRPGRVLSRSAPLSAKLLKNGTLKT
jgi:transposase